LSFILHDTPSSDSYTLSLHALFRSVTLKFLYAGGMQGSRGRAGINAGWQFNTRRGQQHVFNRANNLFTGVGIDHGLFGGGNRRRSEEHTSELQSRENLVCRLLLEKK